VAYYTSDYVGWTQSYYNFDIPCRASTRLYSEPYLT
jgi:hypothetical protein